MLLLIASKEKNTKEMSLVFSFHDQRSEIAISTNKGKKVKKIENVGIFEHKTRQRLTTTTIAANE